MEQTPNLQLPYIMPSQAQKHVTHNEAIRALDALVQLAVLDRHLSTPPGSPAEGDRYLVAAGGSGAWAGEDSSIAAWQDGAWAFFVPRIGWLVWVVDEMRLLSFDGVVWADAAVHSVNPAPLVGVNTTADTTNRLAVKSPASLFDQESGNHRLKINKAAAGDTASVLFQSGYSGRAEFGLAGDDNWHVKVSPDGATWVEALMVDAATGRVRLPAALALSDDNQIVARRHVRDMLTANRTYYVRTDGSNSNNGLANTAGGAFLTIQKAVDTALALDFAGHTVTIQIADGTYTGTVQVGPGVGIPSAAKFIIKGNAATPGNVIISTTGGNCFTAVAGGVVTVQDMELRTTTSGTELRAQDGSLIEFSNLRFGTCAGIQIQGILGGRVIAIGNYSIVGAGTQHIRCTSGVVRISSMTITLTGTPAFTQFIYADRMGLIDAFGVTFAGAATGIRYIAVDAGGINSGGGGASYFPGNAAGAATSPGWYS